MAPSPRRLSSSSPSPSPSSAAVLADSAELVAREQVAAPNTAGLLPSDLEARFRKLKSSSAAIARCPSGSPPAKHGTPRRSDRSKSPPISPIVVQNPKAPTHSSEEGEQDQNFPPPEPSEKREPKSKKSDFGSSSSSSFTSSKEPLSSSPSKQCCCFVFTTKKVAAQSRRGKGGEAVPGSSVHALKEQKKARKALREQEKLTREAAKMVRWARQASRRMNAGSMDEFLSHGEEEFSS